jgi:hypothetical protein
MVVVAVSVRQRSLLAATVSYRYLTPAEPRAIGGS